MLLRCGSGCPPGLATMSVFGSAAPVAVCAPFFRFTVPTIGLTGRNSLRAAGVEVGEPREAVLHGVVDRLRRSAFAVVTRRGTRRRCWSAIVLQLRYVGRRPA